MWRVFGCEKAEDAAPLINGFCINPSRTRFVIHAECGFTHVARMTDAIALRALVDSFQSRSPVPRS